jgi:hypothetical protein
MSGSECPDLQSIVMLLQGAHRIRDEMIAHHRAGLALVQQSNRGPPSFLSPLQTHDTWRNPSQ